MPSKSRPGETRALVALMAWRMTLMASVPFGSWLRISFTVRRQWLNVREANFFVNHSDSAPTFGEIDISLSFRTTSRSRPR
jgi:hypothetical protein